MKFLKTTTLLVALVISFCLVKINVKAYDISENINGVIYTEKDVLERLSAIEGFDFNEYKNIYCTSYYSSLSSVFCYAFSDEIVNSLSKTDDKLIIENFDGCKYYYTTLSYSSNNITSNYHMCIYNSGSVTYQTALLLSNFDFPFLTDSENKDINVLNFNFDETKEQEEMEVTIKGTEILNFILDKTKNIYEVLIANQIFVLCLGVLLSYLIFIILYKTIRK